MNRNPSLLHCALLFAALSLLPLAGCKRESTAPKPAVAASPAPQAPAPVAATDAETFAGTFTGTLPCGNCDSIDETLSLRPDGSFELHDVYAGGKGDVTLDGHWGLDAGGKSLHLDPDSATEAQRVLAITSHAQLDPMGHDGKPDPSGSYTLRRTPDKR